MKSFIFITDTELEEAFKSFRKKKHIVSRPSSISIFKEEKKWKIQFEFDSSAYQKTSCYTAVKPLLNFIKEKILVEDPNYILPVQWEIIRT